MAGILCYAGRASGAGAPDKVCLRKQLDFNKQETHRYLCAELALKISKYIQGGVALE